MSTKSINDLANKLSFYTPQAGDKLVPPPSYKTDEIASKGVIGSVKNIFASSKAGVVQQDEESQGLMSWASSKISGSVEDMSSTKDRFTTFAILAILGALCMMFAFTFLPFVIISPHKFALLFTLGSALMLLSFSFLRGHMAFIKHLSSMERLPFSGSYLVSLVGTLYCSMVMGSYLLTLIFSIIQVIALLYFLVSYIPGGVSALTFMGSMMGSGIRNMVSSG
jgi:hypothetical protein